MKYSGVVVGIGYRVAEQADGPVPLKSCRDFLGARPPTTPLSDDALSRVVCLDASSSCRRVLLPY